jgi:hydrogenase/urease accessory protein HupE
MNSTGSNAPPLPVGAALSKSGKRHFGVCWTFLLLVTLALAGPVAAHDPGISTAQGEVRPDALVLITGFAPADIQQLLPASLRSEGTWSESEFQAAHDGLLGVAPGLWDVKAAGSALTARDIKVELLPGDSVSFSLTFSRPAGTAPLILRANRIAELPSGHRQFVIISDERGSTITKKLLSARDPVLNVPLGGEPTAGAGPAYGPATRSDEGNRTFWGFLRLGVEHIWTGYDHMLFLLALLMVCRSFRSIVTIISCFTVAHSITLALATLEVVSLPSRLVEPAIAASIVVVGLENVWRRGEEPRGRWAVTFVFGLVHGFGFASVLRDLGVGRGSESIVMPLLTFNLGVEVGQVAIAAVVLPLIWRLRRSDHFTHRAVPVLSAIIALAGLYWLLVRTMALA